MDSGITPERSNLGGTVVKLNSMDRLLRVLVLAFLLSLSFLKLWELPYVGTKVQLPELVFLLLFIGWAAKRKVSLARFHRLDYLILLVIVVFAISALVNGGHFLEIAGLLYLFVVYLFFSQFFWRTDLKQWLKLTADGLFLSAGLAALLGVTGFVLASFFGIDNPMSWPASRYYPYLGYIGRARAFTTNPNMLFSFLAMVTLLQFGILSKTKAWSGWSKGIMILIGLGMLLTFSKMLLAFCIGGLWIWYQNKKTGSARVSAIYYGFSFLLFGLLLMGTHILISPVEKTPWEELKQNAYTDDTPFFTSRGHHFILTNYAINKQAAVRAGITHLLFGVGPGGFNAYVAGQKEKGRYPSFFSNYDPHSTYFGAFAETGFLGLLSVLIMFVGLAFYCKKVAGWAENDGWSQGLILGLGGCLLYIAIEAISTDVLNFRHYWVLVGLLGVFLRSKSFGQKLQIEAPI